MAELPASQKVSHQSVNYEHPSPFIRRACRNCKHFIVAKPPRCEHVKDPIRPGDYCKKYQAK